MDCNRASRHKTLQELIDFQTIVSTYPVEPHPKFQRRFIQDYLIEQEMEVQEEIVQEQYIVEQYEHTKKNPHSGFFNFVNDSSDSKELPERRDSSVDSFKIMVKDKCEFRSDSEDSIQSNESDFRRKVAAEKRQQIVHQRLMEVEESSVRETKYKKISKINTSNIKQKTSIQQQHYNTRRNHQHKDIKELKPHKQIKEAKEVKQTKDMDKDKYLSKQEKIQKVRQVGCNCKKSHCLKMYCECFHLQIFCGNNCSCKGCGNLSKSSYHDAAVIEALARNPRAFEEQNPETCFKLNVGLEEVKKGCKCKKTKCLKKYCECYNSGEKCGIFCKCEGCENNVEIEGQEMRVIDMEVEV